MCGRNALKSSGYSDDGLRRPNVSSCDLFASICVGMLTTFMSLFKGTGNGMELASISGLTTIRVCISKWAVCVRFHLQVYRGTSLLSFIKGLEEVSNRNWFSHEE